jgi:cysteine synthase
MMRKLPVTAALTLAGTIAFADGHRVKPGNYHMVIKHQMVGLPYAPPPSTFDKCFTPEDADNPGKLTQHNDKCQQTAFKESGNKLTFTVVCHDRGGTQTGTGEYIFGVDKWTGTVTVDMKEPMTGADIKMISRIESTRTGDCKK